MSSNFEQDALLYFYKMTGEDSLTEKYREVSGPVLTLPLKSNNDVENLLELICNRNRLNHHTAAFTALNRL